jgi:hypothetical protein
MNCQISKAATIIRPIESFDQGQIDRHLGIALQRLTTDDRTLFTHDANERSICFRLGLYLQEEFPDFTVDCEYNRNHDDPDYAKRLFDDELNKLADEARGRPLKRGTDFLFVFPDIIVHRRDTPDNLLVIETKKTTSTVSDRFDRRKLVVYREALKYRFAKFLRFRTDPKEGEALIADSDAV